MTQDLKTLAHEYFVARKNYEDQKEAASKAHAFMNAAKGKLVEAIMDSDFRNFTEEDGTRVSLRRQFSVAVNQENQDDVRNWLMEKAGDYKPYQKTTLDKSAVTAFVKEQVEKGELPEFEVPAFFNLNTYPDITVAGWQNKKALL